MGNAKSQVAFLVEPMDPMPIVLRDFCYDSPSSIQIPPFMSRTKHDGVVHTVDGKVAFLWQGSSMTLMNTERSILMRMERKVCENINTHTIVVDRGRHGASGWLVDITVNFPFPSIRWSPLQTSLILLGLTPQQHNDVATADRILRSVRHKYRRVLIVIEGEHSMGGDLPDLPVFVALKRRTSSICR
ncbi:hypothetical protein DYB35_006903 [Aphanomyces astaci]|uniref:Uncharacterized protein n=1 Tax=Aphanomyces astaci TaxID=112090 RepID=A0A418D5L9_APHAT|nr:hypothetical protein DYB35_006903 [Aphanomyces astaci]